MTATRKIHLLLGALVCLNLAVFTAKQVPWKAWL